LAKTASVDLKEIEQKISQVIDEIETVIIGKRDVIRLVICAVLCNGHILIEDVPGVGKTTLGKTLAIVLGCTFKRITHNCNERSSNVFCCRR